MRQNGIMHRDIKPENMLLSRNGILKVCDFGFACLMQRQQNLTEYVSTRWYRAPELLVSHHYGPEIDVWAIGCIFVELMTGNPLFPGKNDMDMMRLILQMFNGSEELPNALKQTFQQNNMFSSARLPEPTESEYDFDLSLESRLEHSNNSAISFARECLRLDPTKRPSASELLNHDFFNDFSEWFDDEIHTLL